MNTKNDKSTRKPSGKPSGKYSDNPNDKRKILTNFNVIIVSTLIFVTWVLFFDINSVRQLQIVKKEISELENQRDFYRKKIVEDSLVIKNINDKDFLEKYAREQFLMKGDSEIMFIVEPDEDKHTNLTQ